MSTTDVGTKTGNKEKRKASNYICRLVDKWHLSVDRRTKEDNGRPENMEGFSRWCPSKLEISQVKSSKLYGPFICLVDDINTI